MKDIIFRDTVQFGIWKYLDEVNGVVIPQYSCAQPIANGVHLGSGNDTIEDVGECGISPPLISCDGAANSVVFEENPDFTSWGSINTIVINDTEYEKPEEHPVNEIISLPQLLTADDQITIMVQGVHPNRFLVFGNIGSRSARIKIKLKQDWFDSNLISAGLHPSNNNPTVVFDNENLEVSFCLSVLG